ncbi:MAG: class I SAM-dependent methyltransferase [Patescibacteria group bacterium]
MKNKHLAGLYASDKIAQYYKRAKRGKKDATGGIDAEVLEYLRMILPKCLKGKDAIEIGCGDARWSKNLYARGARNVVGLDSSSDMIKLAKAEERRTRSRRLSIHKGDMRDLPFPDESFDLALSSFSIMYFRENELRHIVHEVARILRFGGSFYIATNIVYLREENSNAFEKLKNEIVPLQLGFGDELMSTENAVQTMPQFKAAFETSRLNIQDEKCFAPVGIAIPQGYIYRDCFALGKAVFTLAKQTRVV